MQFQMSMNSKKYYNLEDVRMFGSGIYNRHEVIFLAKI
jgi:hypothetical protein